MNPADIFEMSCNFHFLVEDINYLGSEAEILWCHIQGGF